MGTTAGASRLEAPDKKIIHTFTNDVRRVAGTLSALVEGIKNNVELKRTLTHAAEDLVYVSDDLDDTVKRL